MSTDWRVWQDTNLATDFAARRRAEMLDGVVQFQVMLRLLRQANLSEGTVLDLGCGGGALLETVLAAYPHVAGIGVDGSAAMLECARESFAGRDNVLFIEADFNRTEWVNALPERQFAAIVSGFAIHHSEDERKRELYGELFALLRPGGVFINLEHVASATPLGERFFTEAWVENAVRVRQSQGQDADFDTVMAQMAARPDRDANRLAPVETQLTWLRDCGFVDVDCYWKHFELAILAGYRPE